MKSKCPYDISNKDDGIFPHHHITNWELPTEALRYDATKDKNPSEREKGKVKRTGSKRSVWKGRGKEEEKEQFSKKG